MARLSFRCDLDMVERVDRVRGDVPREAWLRKAVEGVLWDYGEGKPIPLPEARARLDRTAYSAPAEQPSRADMFRRASRKP